MLTTLYVLTIVSTAFICVAGTYVTIKGIITQYNEKSRSLSNFGIEIGRLTVGRNFEAFWLLRSWTRFQETYIILCGR